MTPQHQYNTIIKYYSKLSQYDKSKMYLDSTVDIWFKWIDYKDPQTKEMKSTIIDCRDKATYEDFTSPDHLKIVDWGNKWKETGRAQQYQLVHHGIFDVIYKKIYTDHIKIKKPNYDN